MIEIIPAILAKMPEDLMKAIHLIEPYFKRAHLDIADGIFVANETISGHSELEASETNLQFDVHLMVREPLKQIENWLDHQKADRFIIHVESENVGETINDLRSNGKGVAMAINPDTSISELELWLNLVDFVQFMTIEPGFQGRDFLDPMIDKIRNFHKNYPDVVIAVDGGINPDMAKKVTEVGATIIVSGSFLLKSGGIEEAVQKLKNAV